MVDAKTMAYINMFAVLGNLEELCKLDDGAKSLIPAGRPITMGFAVASGPQMTLQFADGRCTASEGVGACDIKLPFSSFAKFNGMIDGTVTPLPSKGFTKLKFLTGSFIKMTDILGKYLRATPQDLEDEAFFDASTTMMFYVIAQALSQIANHDEIGRFSASNIIDGTIALSIAGGPAAALVVKDHTLRTVKGMPEKYTAIMEFADMHLARQLFDGQVNALACIGTGQIVPRGNMGMIDNVNRILDRVALYLA